MSRGGVQRWAVNTAAAGANVREQNLRGVTKDLCAVQIRFACQGPLADQMVRKERWQAFECDCKSLLREEINAC